MASLNALALTNEALQRGGYNAVTRAQKAVVRSQERLRLLTDEELRARCQSMLQSGGALPPPNRGSRLLQMIRRFLRRGLDEADIQDLAMGAEVFARAPADLPAGSALYPEQVQAAAGLLTNSVIQMDTGEGKTYALLPAAFVLASRFGTVYILCANQYLAERDARRTRRFWDFVGIEPGVGSRVGDEREWSRRVVYTSISELCFKVMIDDLALVSPKYPVRFGAVLMDDADVILLDHVGHHVVNYPVSSTAFDWSFALTFSDSLSREVDIVVTDIDVTPTARLTLRGEQALRTAMGSTTTSNAEYLLMRSAVEAAYVAKHYLVEGDHYVVEQGRVIPIDRTDGRLRRDWRPQWLPALQAANGLRPDVQFITTHRVEPTVLIKQFTVHSGVSGTVGDDALEYLIGYGLAPTRIPPRFERVGEFKEDVIFSTADAANRHAAQLAAAAVEAGRPVLIGTHSIPDAQACFLEIRRRLGATADVRLITGQNEEDEAHLFESAGAVGSVTVATQIAGRGVDIRLTDEARRNGGLVLVSRGHSDILRRDRQFLGRAGRQGDPFTAQFVCSLDDPFMQRFRYGAVKSVYERLHIPPDVAIESPLVNKQVRSAQRSLRIHQLRRRRVRIVLDLVDRQISEDIAGWFRLAQAKRNDERPPRVSLDFVDFLIGRFLDVNVRSMLPRRKTLTRAQAQQLAAIVTGVLQPIDRESMRRTLEYDYVGRTGGEVRAMVATRIREAIRDAELANERTRADAVDAFNAERRAAQERFVALTRASNETARLRGSIAERLATWPRAVSPEADGQDSGGQASGPAVRPAAIGPDGAMATTEPTETDAVRWLRSRGTVTLGELRDLVAAAESPDQLVEIRKVLDQIDATIDHQLRLARIGVETGATAGARNAERLNRRSSLSITNWSIRISWATFLADRTTIEAAVGGSGLPYAQYFRVLTDRLLERWRNVEATITETTLINLIRGADPATLDGLYQLEDNFAKGFAGRPRQNALDWQPRTTDVVGGATLAEENLVDAFLRHVTVADGESEARLVRVLMDFLAAAPLSTLQTPLSIEQRIVAWVRDQKLRGVPDHRWRKDRVWVRRFVGFLHERGAIARVPGATTKMRASVQRLGSNLAEIRTMLPLAVGGLFVAALYGLSQISVGPPRDLPPLPSIVDGMFGGGLLAARTLTAPALAALALGSVLILQLRGVRENYQRMLLIVSGIVFLVLAIWTADWPIHDPWSPQTALAAASLVGMAVVFIFCFNILVTLEVWSSLRLAPAWITYSVAFALLPDLARLGPGRIEAVLPPFLVGAALLLVLRRWSRAEVTVTSAKQRQMDAGPSSTPDVVHSSYRVEGAIHLGTYLLALGLCVALVQIIGFVALASSGRPLAPAAEPILYIALFAALTLLLTWRTVRRRCSPAAWAERLNLARQTLDPEQHPSSLAETLRSIRNRLTLRELTIQILALGVVVVGVGGTLLDGTSIPLALPLFMAVALFASQGRLLALSLFELLVFRTPVAPAVVDMPVFHEPDPDDRTSWSRRFVRWIRRRIGRIVVALLFLLTILARLLDAVAVGEFISGIPDWF